jgi:hypothetical protein
MTKEVQLTKGNFFLISRFHFVVMALRDSCEVQTESSFHFVVVTLRDSCEVRIESSFHFVVVTFELNLAFIL